MSTEEVGAPYSASQSSPVKGAVFLSYASEDAVAAQRIAVSLRDAGVQVWFDKSELRGGDAWDQSIRRQIKSCALFLPIISKHTHERAEGYFRLEWKLAVDRSHLITATKAFLLPVAIDDTPGDDEQVPDRFRELQWTRLPDGETPPEFVSSVRKLLSGETAQAEAKAHVPDVVAAKRSSRLVPALVTVVLAAVAAYLLVVKPWSARTVDFEPPLRSIAVLPFVNMSGDKEQEYFSDGLTEELLDSLSRVNELQVAARTSSFSFKGTDASVGTIARKLNVGAILEGSVRRSGNTVRITAQLINAISGFHVWSQTYDRNLDDVLTVQTDIARATAAALKITLLADAAARIEVGGTRNSAALDAYLQAVNATRSAYGDESLQVSMAHLSEAIRLDPAFAQAYAWRSLIYSNLEAEEFLHNQEADAREAIRLAPGLAEGYDALARFFEATLDFPQARENFERALVLAPGSARVQLMSSQFLADMGQFDEAIAAARRAVTLDPLNRYAHNTLSWALFGARRYQEAIAASAEAISLEYPEGYTPRAIAYYMSGDFESAKSSCEKRPDDPGNQWCLAMVYEKLGRHVDAQSMLEKVRARKGDADAYQYAAIYAQWGKRAEALDWLDTALRRRDTSLSRLKSDPLMDPLRREPRFQAVMRELKFPD
jgi:TolB-like protein/Tfp pilus assembly protein PilF